jgi:lipid-A-disaccharide synthase
MDEIEVPYYQPFGLRTTVIGNPGLARGGKGSRAAFREAFGLTEANKAVLVLPGSRSGELKGVAPVLMEAARRIRADVPGVRLFAAPAGNVAAEFTRMFPDTDGAFTRLTDPAGRFDAMAGADLVLACSGTVTSEVAIQGTPMIVAYRTGWITWALARGLLYRRKHITLLNILNEDREIVPEFVQTRLRAGLIARQAVAWLTDEAVLRQQKELQISAAARLGASEVSPAERAAAAILDELPARQKALAG